MSDKVEIDLEDLEREKELILASRKFFPFPVFRNGVTQIWG